MEIWKQSNILLASTYFI